jgi:hypothetical protein
MRMLKKNNVLIIVFPILYAMHSVSSGSGEIRNLQENKTGWKSADKGISGDCKINDYSLSLTNHGDEPYIIVNDATLRGSFYAEASLRENDNVVLAPIKKERYEARSGAEYCKRMELLMAEFEINISNGKRSAVKIEYQMIFKNEIISLHYVPSKFSTEEVYKSAG